MPLDQQVINLAKAIRDIESGGDNQAKGKSGEYGAYQFMPDTWSKTASKYGVTTPLEQSTLEDQNKVAYGQIKEWKDQGYKPDQIASLWNSGKPEWKGNVGVNSKGVKYDTPQYVNSVYKTYNQLKSGQPETTENTASTVERNQPVKEPGSPTFQINPEEGYLKTAAKTIGNIPQSAWNFGKGIVQTAMEAPKTLSQIPGAFSELKKEVGGAVPAVMGTLQNIPKTAYDMLMPQFGKQLVKGDVQGAAQTVTEDPVGQIAPVLMTAKGLAEKAGVGEQFDTAVSKITNNPVTELPGKAGKGVGEMAKYVIGQEAGLQPSTIGQVLKTPEMFTKENIANADTARATLGQQVMNSINERLNSLTTLGKEYDVIRKSGGRVEIPTEELVQLLANRGIELKNVPPELTRQQAASGAMNIGPEVSKTPLADYLKKQESPTEGNLKVITSAKSIPMKGGDLSALEEFVNTFGNKKTLDANEFLNARKTLDNMAKWDATKSDASKLIAKDLRRLYDQKGKSQIKGLKELDEQFKPEKEFFNQIKKDYLQPNGDFKPGAINKIANLTGKGKMEILARLEKISPGITRKIGIVKALEDILASSGIKVGTYGRTATMVGGFLGGGPLGGLIATILTSPDVVIPALRAFAKIGGVSDSMIGGIISKINSVTELNPPELKIMIGAILSMAQNKKKKYPTSAINPTPQ